MRLIDADADALIARINNSFGAVTRFIIKSILKDAPTIEAEPVRHGRWVDTMCSNCLKVALLEELVGDVGKIAVYVYSNYCPNCGAKMDATDTNVGNKEGD